MTTWIWINVGSGNGLLPDGNNPLPEPLLTYRHNAMTFTRWVFHNKRYLSHQSLKLAWKLLIWNATLISQGPINQNMPTPSVIGPTWCRHRADYDPPRRMMLDLVGLLKSFTGIFVLITDNSRKGTRSMKLQYTLAASVVFKQILRK